jgi:hypothetical protein
MRSTAVFGMFVFRSEPDNHGFCRAIDSVHQISLGISLVYVFLTDAQRIDPDEAPLGTWTIQVFGRVARRPMALYIFVEAFRRRSSHFCAGEGGVLGYTSVLPLPIGSRSIMLRISWLLCLIARRLAFSRRRLG